MKSNQYLALWNLKILNEQAFQKYKDFEYSHRQRVIPQTEHTDLLMVQDEFTWQNLINKDEWYDQWQSSIEQRIVVFKDNSVKNLMRFNNIDLGEWSDTLANRFEKQMYIVEELQSEIQSKFGIYTLNRTYFDKASKSLYVIVPASRERYKVRVIDFSRTGSPSRLLDYVYKSPLENHDFYDIEFALDPAKDEDDRLIQYTVKNINTKFKKEVQTNHELLCVKNQQVWVDKIHI